MRKLNIQKAAKKAIEIDVNSIPKHKQDYIAAATLDFIHRFLTQPGGRDALNKRIATMGL